MVEPTQGLEQAQHQHGPRHERGNEELFFVRVRRLPSKLRPIERWRNGRGEISVRATCAPEVCEGETHPRCLLQRMLEECIDP